MTTASKSRVRTAHLSAKVMRSLQIIFMRGASLMISVKELPARRSRRRLAATPGRGVAEVASMAS